MKKWIAFLVALLLACVLFAHVRLASATVVEVEKGDTLWSIAQKCGQPGWKHHELVKANPWLAGTKLRPGQLLVVPLEWWEAAHKPPEQPVASSPPVVMDRSMAWPKPSPAPSLSPEAVWLADEWWLIMTAILGFATFFLLGLWKALGLLGELVRFFINLIHPDKEVECLGPWRKKNPCV